MKQLHIRQYKEKDAILINNSILKGLQRGIWGGGTERSWEGVIVGVYNLIYK